MSSPRVEYAYADGSANTARAVSVTYPDGSVLSYDYGAADGDDDRLSRVQKIADDGVNLVEYSYYGQANVLKTKYPAPNVTLDFASPAGVPYGGCLDRFGRVKQNPWVKGSGPIAGATYQYDRASNRTQMQPQGFTSTNAVERYSYDGLQRLTRSVRGSATTLKAQEAWGLDATGNWGKYDVLDVDTPAQNLAQQRTSNPANEITDVTETYGPVWPTPAYDRAGNTKSFPQPLTPTSSYSGTYDAWNRLVEVKQGSTVVATYQYDGLNRRVTQTSSGTTRHYYYSADWRVLEERTGTSTSADRQFFWGVRYVDDLVCRLTGTTRLYNCQDANWNTVAIVDSTGAVQQRYRYSAYGTPTRLDANGNVATGSDTLLWETLYAGYRYDRNTGLYQVRYRWLNPTLGAWVTVDPVDFNAGDPNLLRYGYTSPIDTTDPLGLWSITDEPGLAESLIPFWGSMRAAAYNFNQGNIGLGLLYSALAVVDVAMPFAFASKAAGTIGLKAAWSPGWGAITKYKPLHFSWEAGQQSLHALATKFGPRVFTIEPGDMARWVKQFRIGWPLLSQRLAAEAGQSAHNCFTAVYQAFSRGWFYLDRTILGWGVTRATQQAIQVANAPPPPQLREVIKKTDPTILHVPLGAGWFKLGEYESAGTWLSGNWFSSRYWKVWYQGTRAVKKQEVDAQHNPIGPMIDLY